MSEDLITDKSRTGLIVIDLQKGVTAMPSRPYTAQEVISNASELVNAFRKNNMPVFLVHVEMTNETMLHAISDQKFSRPQPASPDWAEFVSELTPTPSDVVITKRQWGAFYGTELDLQLRRRKIDTIVLCGIATDFGVESTARFAYEYGYQQIFAEDAMTSRSDEQHNAASTSYSRGWARLEKLVKYWRL
ncbi:MAG: isochorismatase family protein [Methanotrichaceae archaeon]